VGDVQDYLLIIATPLFVFAGIEWAKGHWTGKEISQFVVLFAFGHHLPGMMRAYGDRELFERFRTRFILAPIGLLLLCVTSTTTGHSEFRFLVVFWGWWHYVMQTYGFMRIYDTKVGSVSRTTQILDRAMCLSWFATPLLLYSVYSSPLPGLVTRVQETGLPLLSRLSLDLAHTTVAAATTGVTGAFLVNAVWQWSRGRGPSPRKLFLMATTFALYWYALTTIANIMVAYALFEIFHDIQYLTIVWAFNRGRVRQGADLPAFTRFLFQPRLNRIALYLALILSYGMLERTTRLQSGETLGSAWEGVFLASMVLHYYYDGFIWKLREASTKAPLDIHVAARGEAVGAAGA
jgi:putative flippase GtrA